MSRLESLRSAFRSCRRCRKLVGSRGETGKYRANRSCSLDSSKAKRRSSVCCAALIWATTVARFIYRVISRYVIFARVIDYRPRFLLCSPRPLWNQRAAILNPTSRTRCEHEKRENKPQGRPVEKQIPQQVRWATSRHKNPVLRGQCGHGGGIVVIDLLVIGPNLLLA